LKTVFATVLIASLLSHEYQLALIAIPRRPLGNDSRLAFGSPKECSYTFKHIPSIVYTNLLLPCSWGSCRTWRLLISLLLFVVTAKA
jgi:hypothetical protein